MEAPEVRRRSFLLQYTDPELLDKPEVPKVYNQEQLEMKHMLNDLNYLADRELYLPSFEWQQYSEQEKQFDVEHRLKHTYREIIKPEHGYDEDEKVRGIIMGQFYEGSKELDTSRERLLELQGGLKMSKVKFKFKSIQTAWNNASKLARERTKFEELQQKKQEEIENRKKFIKDQMRRKFAQIFLKKKADKEEKKGGGGPLAALS